MCLVWNDTNLDLTKKMRAQWDCSGRHLEQGSIDNHEKAKVLINKDMKLTTKIEGCVKQDKTGQLTGPEKNAFQWRRTGLQNKRVSAGLRACRG